MDKNDKCIRCITISLRYFLYKKIFKKKNQNCKNYFYYAVSMIIKIIQPQKLGSSLFYQ